jgi:hypothetical protein
MKPRERSPPPQDLLKKPRLGEGGEMTQTDQGPRGQGGQDVARVWWSLCCHLPCWVKPDTTAHPQKSWFYCMIIGKTKLKRNRRASGSASLEGS